MKYHPRGPQPDPELYLLVKSKDGWFWRKRRGLGGKPAVLNAVLSRESELLGETTAGAKRLHEALKPYKGRMDFGRFGARVAAVIRKAVKKECWPDYGCLKEYAFQRAHSFDAMLRYGKDVMREDGRVIVRVPVPEGGAVLQKSGAAEQYRLALILVIGDPMDPDARLETKLVEGREYNHGGPKEEPIVLSIAVPQDGRPWMVCLRVEAWRWGAVAEDPRHHGLGVVAWG